MTAREILERYPNLTMPQLHAALLYYYENTAEIEAEFAEDENWQAEHERAKAEHLSKRPGR
jgi:hypothetical protein